MLDVSCDFSSELTGNPSPPRWTVGRAAFTHKYCQLAPRRLGKIPRVEFNPVAAEKFLRKRRFGPDKNKSAIYLPSTDGPCIIQKTLPYEHRKRVFFWRFCPDGER